MIRYAYWAGTFGGGQEGTKEAMQGGMTWKDTDIHTDEGWAIARVEDVRWHAPDAESALGTCAY